MEVQGLKLQFPFQRHGRRWITNRRVASLILQLTGNRNGIRRPEQGSDTSSYFRDRYSDVLRDSELAFEHRHLLFDGLQGPHDTLPTTRTCQSMSPSLARIIHLKE